MHRTGASALRLTLVSSLATQHTPVGKWKTIDDAPGDARSIVTIWEDHGMTIIWDMAQDGNEWKGGRIMDPESGSIYRCKLKPIEGGATPSRCGWITDHFGLTWQIVPKRFIELIGDKNPQKVQAVIAAMMKMVKLDVAVLESAYEAAT